MAGLIRVRYGDASVNIAATDAAWLAAALQHRAEQEARRKLDAALFSPNERETLDLTEDDAEAILATLGEYAGELSNDLTQLLEELLNEFTEAE